MKIIGIGTDIVECLRMARMIEHHGEQFIHRVFTPNEVRVCNRSATATQQFASRWAAKEAVLRALGIHTRKGFDLRNIEIRRDKSGKLSAAFRGAARDLVEQLGVTQILVSTAHCRSVATAQAIALGRSPRRKRKPKKD